MKKYFSITLFIFLFHILAAQESDKVSSLDFHGYISGMPSLFWMKIKDDSTGVKTDSSAWQVLLHNRLNLDWYPSERISGSIQFRNQIIAGEFIKAAQIDNGFVKENYFLPLTFQYKFADQYLLSLGIDRVWLQYTYNKLEVKFGRQRINWGQTFVWNPNDLFNSYNPFDFDYVERPGADAIRVQYYMSYTSSIDLALKVDKDGNITTAGLCHFNKWNTDFQIMGGYFSQTNKQIIEYDTLNFAIEWEDKDLVGGFGFSGAISNLSIRGELSYFYSIKDDPSKDLLLTSLALDYSFKNQTYLMFEFFYNSNVQLLSSSFLNFYGGTQNVKTLTFTKYNAFGQFTYPINPIINTTLAGMYFFDKDLTGFYVGPSAEFSLSNNLSLSAFFQFFAFKYENPLTRKKEWLKSNFAFLRLKWNF